MRSTTERLIGRGPPTAQVTSRALLPSTAVVSFELSRGVRMVTVTNTTPVSATRTVNRVALLRNFAKKVPGGGGAGGFLPGANALQQYLDGFAKARRPPAWSLHFTAPLDRAPQLDVCSAPSFS